MDFDFLISFTFSKFKERIGLSHLVSIIRIICLEPLLHAPIILNKIVG